MFMMRIVAIYLVSSLAGGLSAAPAINTAEGIPAAPVVKRVKLPELRLLLPADTPSVTPAERADVLRQRAEDVARRFSL